MQFIAYADETARQANRQLKPTYEGALGLSGFIAEKNDWVQFSDQWNGVLTRFNVPYFHFRELNKSERRKPENPYAGWSDDRVDDFIFALAKIAGQNVPFGSNVFLATPDHIKYRPDSWKQAADLFFTDCLEKMNLHWGTYKEPVHFFFDRQDNKSMVAQLTEARDELRKKDRRIGDLIFVSKKTMPMPPLQAADMLAYALGQNAERVFVTQERQMLRIIDVLLFENTYPKGHPKSLPWFINGDVWRGSLIEDFRRDKKAFDASRKAAGLKKAEYFPQKHFGNMVDRT